MARWMRGRLRAITALALGVGLLALAPGALAADRFAAPNGNGPEPCQAFDPCNVQTAFGGSVANDRILLNAGSYGSPGTRITTPLWDGGHKLTIQGLAGGPARPVLWMNANPALQLTGTGTVVSDVRVENAGSYAILNANGAGPVKVDRVFAHTTGAVHACSITSSSTVLNSVCWAQGGAAVDGLVLTAVNPVTTATVRNVTAVGGIGLEVAGPGGDQAIVNATNLIARGSVADVATFGRATVSLATSNYATVDTGGGGSVTPPGTAGNQTAAPLFVDAAGGDFRPAPGSPTIAAGTNDAANGTFDLDAQPHTLGGWTDIGAYEHVPAAPLAATGAADAITVSTATVAGTVNPNEQATTYRFDYGTSTAYGASTAPVAAGAGPVAVPVSRSLTGLQPGTTYHYRIVASNPAGASVGEDRTLTTTARPAPAPGPCANGVDDDRDGFVDGADPQCQRGRGVEAPIDNPLLTCSDDQIVLADVLRARGGRVRFFGVTERAFAGRAVGIYIGKRRVARARVQPDGTFSASAMAPRGRAARSARYQARLGTLRSANLKLSRRMLITSARLRGGMVVLTGRVLGRRPRGRPFVELAGRRHGCSDWVRIGRARLRRDGTFTVSAPAFTDVDIAVYRARVRLGPNRVTVTLPRVIELH